jgi:hypothetical protein
MFSSVAAQQPSLLDRYKQPVTRMTGQQIGDPSLLARPTQILWLDRKLVVLDRRADSMLVVLSADDGRLVRRFGRKGGGPGEFVGPWSLLTNGVTDEFWVYDTSLRRLTKVNLQRDFARGAFHPGEMITLQGGGELNSLQWLRDGRVVSAGFLSRGLFATFNREGKELAPMGQVILGDPKTPMAVRQTVYRLAIAVDPPKRRIAAAVRYADRIEIYDDRAKHVVTADRPFSFEPAVTIVGTRGSASDVALGDNLRYGYVDIAAGDRFLYALFSGRTSGGFGSRAGFGRHVHVFDWAGRLRNILEIADDVIAIAVDPGERQLYALRHDPEPGVLKFTLPPPLALPQRHSPSPTFHLGGSQ